MPEDCEKNTLSLGDKSSRSVSLSGENLKGVQSNMNNFQNMFTLLKPN